MVDMIVAFLSQPVVLQLRKNFPLLPLQANYKAYKFAEHIYGTLVSVTLNTNT